MIGSAQYVIDHDAIIGQREESTAIENWHAAKCRVALNYQAPSRREDGGQMGKEQARQRVPSAEGNRQVLACDDEVRQLDWRLHSDHDAVSPVVTYYPGINFVEARKALSRCRFLPVAQHALNQTPFVLPGSGRGGLREFQHVAPKLRTERKRNET